MPRRDQLDKSRRLDMRVNFCGGDVGMAQHRLQSAQIRPPFEEMSRECMTQDMRADPFGRNTRVGGKRAEQLEKTNAAQMLAAGGEKITGRIAAHCFPSGHGGARAVLPFRIA